jgi:hypothetical protein
MNIPLSDCFSQVLQRNPCGKEVISACQVLSLLHPSCVCLRRAEEVDTLFLDSKFTLLLVHNCIIYPLSDEIEFYRFEIYQILWVLYPPQVFAGRWLCSVAGT